jgi:hypothetical protein
VDGIRIGRAAAKADKCLTGRADKAQMTEIKRHLKQRYLKRRLARNSYTVDPERVATAMVVRLAQQGDPLMDPGSGPSHAPASDSRLRQAA